MVRNQVGVKHCRGRQFPSIFVSLLLAPIDAALQLLVVLSLDSLLHYVQIFLTLSMYATQGVSLYRLKVRQIHRHAVTSCEEYSIE